MSSSSSVSAASSATAGSESDPSSSVAADRSALLDRPFAHNPHWADVKRIKQDDGEGIQIVPISYPAHYSDVLDLFRGVLATHELSYRSLLLTEAVIDVNSANYSAWHFRRLCLKATNADIDKELEWVAGVALDTPKNYQLWHHRRCLLESLGSRSVVLCHRELELTRSVLDLDSKNYHAWSHRQWTLKFFAGAWSEDEIRTSASSAHGKSSDGAATHSSLPAFGSLNPEIWSKELEFVEEMLKEDVRNNSAWNQRFFVRTCQSRIEKERRDAEQNKNQPSTASSSTPASIPSSTFSAPALTPSIISEDISYTFTHLPLAPHNESAWNFLEGLTRLPTFNYPNHGRAMERGMAETLQGFPELQQEDEEAVEKMEKEVEAEKDQQNKDGMSEESIEQRTSNLIIHRRCQRYMNRFAQSLLIELWEQAATSTPKPDAFTASSPSSDSSSTPPTSSSACPSVSDSASSLPLSHRLSLLSDARGAAILLQQLDRVRVKYWKWRQECIEHQIEQLRAQQQPTQS